jgi:hypothetical protein
MKVYSSPVEAPKFPSPFCMEEYEKNNDEYIAKVKKDLIDSGFTGKNTGKMFYMPIADGAAQYMYADAPRRSCLIHLEVGDAWDHPDAQFIPQKEVLRRIKAREKMDEAFKKAKATQKNS